MKRQFCYFWRILDFENRCKLVLYMSVKLLFKITKLILIMDITFTIDGKKLCIKTNLGDLGRIYEIWSLRVYEKLPSFRVEQYDVCLDIGAGFGSVCLQWARVNTKGCIISVEPHPDTFSRLKQNCELNNMDNVECVNAAIGSSSGTCSIMSSQDSSMARVAENPAENLITVQMLSIDDLVSSRDLDHVDLMKIDVEGYELECLKGAKETLDNTGKIVIEYHSQSLKNKVVSMLTEREFGIEDVDGVIYAKKE